MTTSRLKKPAISVFPRWHLAASWWLGGVGRAGNRREVEKRMGENCWKGATCSAMLEVQGENLIFSDSLTGVLCSDQTCFRCSSLVEFRIFKFTDKGFILPAPTRISGSCL